MKGRGLSDRRQVAHRARRSGDDIADAIDAENQRVLVDRIDQALQLADHAAPLARARRCWAWVIATASASAASGEAIWQAGSSIFSIIAICAFYAWPAPTIVFLTTLAAYSATSRPSKAGAASAIPRACPSLRADCGSR